MKRKTTAQQPNPPRPVDPTARVDIALQRLIELAVQTHADATVQNVYTRYQRVVNKAIHDVVGPNTQAGQVAKGAVHTLLFINQRLEELQRHRTTCPPNADGGLGGDAA